MLQRFGFNFNDEVVKVFEYLQVDCWNPDHHFLTDKIPDDECGWVYKMDRVEDEFVLFLNILYSTKDSRLKRVIDKPMQIEYVGGVS